MKSQNNFDVILVVMLSLLTLPTALSLEADNPAVNLNDPNTWLRSGLQAIADLRDTEIPPMAAGFEMTSEQAKASLWHGFAQSLIEMGNQALFNDALKVYLHPSWQLPEGQAKQINMNFAFLCAIDGDDKQAVALIGEDPNAMRELVQRLASRRHFEAARRWIQKLEGTEQQEQARWSYAINSMNVSNYQPMLDLIASQDDTEKKDTYRKQLAQAYMGRSELEQAVEVASGITTTKIADEIWLDIGFRAVWNDNEALVDQAISKIQNQRIRERVISRKQEKQQGENKLEFKPNKEEFQLRDQAQLAMDQGDFQEAARLIMKITNPELRYGALNTITQPLLEDQKFDQIELLIEPMNDAFAQFTISLKLAETHFELGQKQAARQRLEDAVAAIPQLDAYRKQGMTGAFTWAGCYGAAARMYALLGDDEGWQKYFDLAVERLDSMTPNLDQFVGYAGLTKVCFDNNRLDQLHRHLMQIESPMSRYLISMYVARALHQLAEQAQREAEAPQAP